MSKRVVTFVVMGLFLFLCRETQGAGTIGLPFQEGETWMICRGYNVGTDFHGKNPVLDISLDPDSAISGGCNIYSEFSRKASQGQEVIAPADGIVHHFGADGLCLDLGDGRALGILHFATRWPNRQPISKGGLLGILAPPNGNNGNYSHIHIQAHKGGCQGSLVPFTEENGFRFEGVPDLPYDGTPNQHAGIALTRPASCRSWEALPTTLSQAKQHPNGTLVKGNGPTVYFLQGGKKRGFASEEAFCALGYTPGQVVRVSDQELGCYETGSAITPSSLPAVQLDSKLKEGDLVWLNGSSRVYVVSDRQLRWLNVTADQFVRYGYQWANVKHVSGSYTPGVELGSSFFEGQPTCAIPTTPEQVVEEIVKALVPDGTRANGEVCYENRNCISGICFPGPEQKQFCIQRDQNCVRPGTEGVKFGASYSYNNKPYTCTTQGLVQSRGSVPPGSVANGQRCTNPQDCVSGFCDLGPEEQGYCLHRDSHCPWPGTDGIRFDQERTLGEKTYVCKSGVGLVVKGADPYYDPAPGSVPDGEQCRSKDDCASSPPFCYPFVDGKSYCLYERKTCAFPGSQGKSVGETTCQGNTLYQCKADPANWTAVGSCAQSVSSPVSTTSSTTPALSPLTPGSVPYGGRCYVKEDCAASQKFCYPFVDGKSYCLYERKTCALPGGQGKSVNETTCYNGQLYVCRPDPQNWTAANASCQ